MQKRTLRVLRAEKELTQKEVAQKLGISEYTWSNWENGKTYPDVPDIMKIQSLFNVAFSDIKFLEQGSV